MIVNPEIIGSMAATLTTISFLPQTIKVVVTRDTSGISLWMYILFTIGVMFWLAYGIMLGMYPIIIANAITVPLSWIILIFKIREIGLKKAT